MVTAHLTTQYEGDLHSTGIFKTSIQARVMQAIEDSLPAFVQQLYQGPSSSASSSSPSLHDSGTTPGSSPHHQSITGPDIRVHPPQSQHIRGVDRLQADDRPWTPLLPTNGYNLAEQPAGLLTRVIAPVRRTHPAIATDYRHSFNSMQSTLSNSYGSFADPSSSSRNSSERSGLSTYGYPPSDPAAHAATADLSARRYSAVSIVQATHTQLPGTVTKEVPRAAPMSSLKPRKSMDSGYHSMHTLSLDEPTIPEEHRLPGSVFGGASLRSVRFDNEDDEIEDPMPSARPPEEGYVYLQVEQRPLHSDPFLRRAASAPHDLTVPGTYPQADDPGPASVSDPCLPLFSPSSPDAMREGSNLYDGGSWGSSNSWV